MQWVEFEVVSKHYKSISSTTERFTIEEDAVEYMERLRKELGKGYEIELREVLVESGGGRV